MGSTEVWQSEQLNPSSDNYKVRVKLYDNGETYDMSNENITNFTNDIDYWKRENILFGDTYYKYEFTGEVHGTDQDDTITGTTNKQVSYYNDWRDELSNFEKAFTPIDNTKKATIESQQDNIRGKDGDDYINGRDGNDSLQGDDGNDVLISLNQMVGSQ